MRLALSLTLTSMVALAQGTEPRAAPESYPAHAKVNLLAIGAEYLVHSFSGHGQTFVTPDYLVVEVALFAPKGQRVAVSSGNFTLRLNGKKRALLAQAPRMVAASLKYPDWEVRRQAAVGVGMGDGGILIGQPAPVGRFPGDRRAEPSSRRLPRAPEPENPGGIEREPPITADQLAVEAALPEGDLAAPVSGYLYFPYKGKTRKLKSVELLYEGVDGSAVLKLD